MKFEFDQEQIESALRKYARLHTSNPDDLEFEVRIMWRAKKAVVTVRRKVPTLTDQVINI